MKRVILRLKNQEESMLIKKLHQKYQEDINKHKILHTMMIINPNKVKEIHKVK